jgi:hypothetical protein
MGHAQCVGRKIAHVTPVLLALGAVAALALAGCAGRRPPAVWPGAAPPTVAEVEARLAARADTLHALRLGGIGQYRDPGGTHRFQVQAALEPPVRARLFASIGPFASLFTLVMREDGFGLDLPMRHEVLVAALDEKLVIDGRELPVTPEALWPAFIPDRLAARIPAGAAMVRDGQDYRVAWRDSLGSEALWISEKEGGVVRYRGESTGGEVIDIRFDRYAWRDGIWYPGSTSILLPEFKAEVTFWVHSLDANPEFPADAFALRIPANATIRHVGRPAGE